MALRILFAGSGEFGAPSLRALVEGGHEIVRVISQPDRPAGRGREVSPTPIAGLAEEAGMKVLKTANINEEQLPQADLLVVIAFGQKIAPELVDRPRLGSINLHASLLPKYRGAAPINWAIINGERLSGASVIRLAQKMDAGAILGQQQLEIIRNWTAGEYHDLLAEWGAKLLVKVVGELKRGTAVEVPQDESLATQAPKLTREATKIHWMRSAKSIVNLIRGVYPWPGCRVRLLNGGNEVDRVTLHRAGAIDSLGDPGVIGDDLTIGTGGGTLEVVSLQPEGKKPMSLRDYFNGHDWEPGMRVESL